MEPEFIFLQAGEAEYREFPWYLRCGPRKEARRLEYLKETLPVSLQVCSVLDLEGIGVRLPFSFSQLSALDPNFLLKIPERIEGMYGGRCCTAESRLLPLFQADRFWDGRTLPLLLVQDAVDRVLEEKRIPKKEARLVLFGGDGDISLFLLELLGRQYNYLAYVDKGYSPGCRTLLERLFEEQGLAVSVWENQWEEVVPGDVYIDTAGAGKAYCRRLERGSVLLDLTGKNDRRYVESRMKEGHLFQSFHIGRPDRPEEMQPIQLLEAACFREKRDKHSGTGEMLWKYYRQARQLHLQVLGVS